MIIYLEDENLLHAYLSQGEIVSPCPEERCFGELSASPWDQVLTPNSLSTARLA